MTMKSDALGFSLIDIFLLIGMQGRTGELVLESGNNIGTMLFHQGKILQAFSPYSRAIGDLLVEEGLISDAELMETLKKQKNSSYSPLGSLLLKTGKITFEVIEMMVQEQIRSSVKEFQSWKGLNYSFLDKDIQPYDRIHLTVHEFILPDTLQAAVNFLSEDPRSQNQDSPATAPTLS
jgi:glutaredoxin-related protein